MQYHLNGFEAGDPSVMKVHDKAGNTSDNEVDVLIVGCGPAGLTLAAQLSFFPEIVTKIVDKKTGPLEIGQADGIACRSMEMFEAFGFADRVKKEAYWVNETCFWRPSENGLIFRADRIQDVEDDLSEFPHTILSQARVHDFYLEHMANSSRQLVPDYAHELVDLKREKSGEFPVKATLTVTDSIERTEQRTISARYVVGCDGARSKVREIMGLELQGEATRQLWGVMDILPNTDFPDIRLKSAIQSEAEGSLLIIPREGGYLVRMYIELEELKKGERARDRRVSPEFLISKARAILAPYKLDVREVAWWSAYEIGQRVCERFDDEDRKTPHRAEPRIFIAGDACHTHSPKAGQGMNVSMADTFNLGWKLASVLKKQSHPSLLNTYHTERQSKAQELIDFDRDMARLFSIKPKTKKDAEKFQRYFQKHGRYTAGVETQYESSQITGSGDCQHLASGMPIGRRFHSAPVIRLADAKCVHIGHVLKADGRWRLLAFGGHGDIAQKGSDLRSLCEFLVEDPISPVLRFTPKGEDIDSVIDVRAVLQASHRNIDLVSMPSLILPTKGRLQLTDYEKIYCSVVRGKQDIYELRGIDRKNGAVIVVRPDQYVADIVRLNDRARLCTFFEEFMLEQSD